MEDTLRIARQLGQNLNAPALVELRSDIGGGKTTFTKGLVEGLGSSDQVSSPTFTISKVYRIPEKDIEVHHFDFYRLNDAGIIRMELAESVQDKRVITVIEWAGVVEDVLPEDRIIITIAADGEDTRRLTFNATSTVFAHVLDELRDSK